MAESTLTPSELERRRLRATKAQLDQRWLTVSGLLRGHLGLNDHEVAVDADYQGGGVWTGFRGAAVERVARNRGTATVVPLLQLPDALTAWLGYQEVWDLESGRKPYAFRQAGLTVYFGEVGDPVKPQIFRLEWAGLREWDRSGVGFQSNGAGHPHWQVDAFEALRQPSTSQGFESELVEEVENFDNVAAPLTLSERLRQFTFEKMHLASAAPWWTDRPSEFGFLHLNAPNDQAELTRWLDAAIRYIRQELSRCDVKR